MRLAKELRVDYETAKARALAALSFASPKPSSMVAGHVWPGHRMKAQGAGGAGSRLLKRMEKDGLVGWVHVRTGRFYTWGWIKTRKGSSQ